MANDTTIECIHSKPLYCLIEQFYMNSKKSENTTFACSITLGSGEWNSSGFMVQFLSYAIIYELKVQVYKCTHITK